MTTQAELLKSVQVPFLTNSMYLILDEGEAFAPLQRLTQEVTHRGYKHYLSLHANKVHRKKYMNSNGTLTETPCVNVKDVQHFLSFVRHAKIPRLKILTQQEEIKLENLMTLDFVELVSQALSDYMPIEKKLEHQQELLKESVVFQQEKQRLEEELGLLRISKEELEKELRGEVLSLGSSLKEIQEDLMMERKRKEFYEKENQILKQALETINAIASEAPSQLIF